MEEATIWGLYSGKTQGNTIAAARDYIAPVLIGKHRRNNTLAGRMMNSFIRLHHFTKMALEMALWDISGKAVFCPFISYLVE